MIVSTENQQQSQSTQQVDRASKSPSSEPFKILKLLAKSRHPVYLAQTLSTEEAFVAKFFDIENGMFSQAYAKEKEFASLDHPNLISVFETIDCHKIQKNEKTQYSSIVMMEYSPFGDFSALV